MPLPNSAPAAEWSDVEALRVVRGDDCPGCYRPKTRRQCFCRRCYFSLDAKERSGLYLGLADGFAKIYRAAIDKLRARGKEVSLELAEREPGVVVEQRQRVVHVDPAKLAEIEERLLELARAGKITTEAMHQAGREFRRELRRIGTLTPGGIERRIKRAMRAKAEVCPSCNGHKTAAAKVCGACRREAALQR